MRKGWWLDLFCVLALVGACVMHWPTGDVSLTVDGPEAPAWGTIRDALLDGPDAGEWARSMLALHDGRYEALESHRLPSWQLVVNSVMAFESNVVRAGHLANHLLNLVVGLSIFLIARLWGQRWIGLGAGALAMLSGHALAVSLRFGVDAAVVALIPLAMVGAVLACRRWQWGVVSGVLAALATATHFSTLGYVLPGLALILLGARQSRWLSALGHLAGFGLLVYLLTLVFPVSTWEGFQVSIANGISPGYQGNGRVSNWGTALGIIQDGMGTSIERSVAQLLVQIRPDWLPWRAGLILPWLGVLGIGLKRSAGPSSDGWRGWLVRSDWAMGLGLLFCLAPLPVFAAAQAPLRYADNMLAVGALLLVRGMASVIWMALQLCRVGHVRWLNQTLYAALGGALFVGAVQRAAPARKVLYPTLEEIGYWQLGQELSKHFSSGSGVASPVREALVEGRLTYCPRRICPERATEDAYWTCLAVHAIECDGEDPVGYVVTSADLYDPNAVARRDMDKWVAKNWKPVGTVENPRFTAEVYAIPRAEIPLLVKKGDSWSKPDLMMGPPGGGPVGPATPPLGPDGRPLPGDVRPPPGTVPPAQPLPGAH
jgi:4-amino-4-deoxy-L-arabinose transferase-like glycosyltransferase